MVLSTDDFALQRSVFSSTFEIVEKLGLKIRRYRGVYPRSGAGPGRAGREIYYYVFSYEFRERGVAKWPLVRSTVTF